MKKSLILLGAILPMLALTSCGESGTNGGSNGAIECKIAIGQKYYDSECLAEMKGYDIEDYDYTDDSIIFNNDNTGKITRQYSYDSFDGTRVYDYYIDFDWDYLNDGSILAYYTWEDAHYETDHTEDKLEEGEVDYYLFTGNEDVLVTSGGAAYYSESILN